MAGSRDKEFTMIVPGIDRQQAELMKDKLIKIVKKTAPKAKGSIVIGKKENFERLMGSCKKRLKGGN